MKKHPLDDGEQKAIDKVNPFYCGAWPEARHHDFIGTKGYRCSKCNLSEALWWAKHGNRILKDAKKIET